MTLLMLSPAWALTARVLPVRDLTKNCILSTESNVE
jgi:hypothetical protein